jgi:hypothetical protein
MVKSLTECMGAGAMSAGQRDQTLRVLRCLPIHILRHVKDLKSGRCAFFMGSNTSCRAHIRSHYEIYKARCEEGGIELNERCIPRQILKKAQLQAVGKSTSTQMTLDNVLEVAKPCEFSKDNILHAVAQLVVCDDQVCNMQGKRKKLMILYRHWYSWARLCSGTAWSRCDPKQEQRNYLPRMMLSSISTMRTSSS